MKIQIIEEKENEIILEIQLTEAEKQEILTFYNRKRLTKKLLQKFILDSMKNVK